MTNAQRAALPAALLESLGLGSRLSTLAPSDAAKLSRTSVGSLKADQVSALSADQLSAMIASGNLVGLNADVLRASVQQGRFGAALARSGAPEVPMQPNLSIPPNSLQPDQGAALASAKDSVENATK
jgi:hypothetical protein